MNLSISFLVIVTLVTLCGSGPMAHAQSYNRDHESIRDSIYFASVGHHSFIATAGMAYANEWSTIAGSALYQYSSIPPADGAGIGFISTAGLTMIGGPNFTLGAGAELRAKGFFVDGVAGVMLPLFYPLPAGYLETRVGYDIPVGEQTALRMQINPSLVITPPAMGAPPEAVVVWQAGFGVVFQ